MLYIGFYCKLLFLLLAIDPNKRFCEPLEAALNGIFTLLRGQVLWLQWSLWKNEVKIRDRKTVAVFKSQL